MQGRNPLTYGMAQLLLEDRTLTGAGAWLSQLFTNKFGTISTTLDLSKMTAGRWARNATVQRERPCPLVKSSVRMTAWSAPWKLVAPDVHAASSATRRVKQVL
jgi:hypothetical protein